MAPPGSTIQSLANLLQNKYLPGMVRQFNDSYPNLMYIRQNTSDLTTEGDKAIIAIETGLNEAGGTHGESADVASAVAPTVKRVEVSLKQMTFRARITWRLMKKARTTSNAFARSLDLTMRSTRDAMTLTANQYTWGDGSGVVGRIKTDPGASPSYMDIDRAHGLTGGGQPYMLIRPGQVLHVLDTKGYGTTNDRCKVQVTKVDVDTAADAVRAYFGTELAGDADNIAINDYVYLQNSIAGWVDSDETEANTPPMGFLGFYDASLVDPLQGLAVSDEPSWAPKKVAIAQATVIADLNKLRTTFMKRLPKGRAAYYISSHETRDRWYNALEQKAEWRNVKTIDGAFDVAVYGGRPWFVDHTAPDGVLFCVPAGDYINRYSASQFIEVVDDDNSVLHQVPNKTVFDVMFTTLYEFGIKRRNVLVSGTGMTW